MRIDISERKPHPSSGIRAKVGVGVREYVHAYSVESAKALRGHAYKTLWPAKLYSLNIAPHSEQESIRRWKAAAKLDRSGFRPRYVIGIDNSARDASGKRYVGRVNQGMTDEGRRVSSERYRANYLAAERTLDMNDLKIGRNAKTRAETRKTKLR